MALSIHCDVCNAADVVTFDRPEPLPGWQVTRRANGSTERLCPACRANTANPPSQSETLPALGNGGL